MDRFQLNITNANENCEKYFVESAFFSYAHMLVVYENIKNVDVRFNPGAVYEMKAIRRMSIYL